MSFLKCYRCFTGVLWIADWYLTTITVNVSLINPDAAPSFQELIDMITKGKNASEVRHKVDTKHFCYLVMYLYLKNHTLLATPTSTLLLQEKIFRAEKGFLPLFSTEYRNCSLHANSTSLSQHRTILEQSLQRFHAGKEAAPCDLFWESKRYFQ